MTKTKLRRAALLALAHEARARLEQAIEVIEDDAYSDDEVEAFRPFVTKVHAAAAPTLSPSWRWFVHAIAAETRTEKQRERDAMRIAHRVRDVYARRFPALAHDLDLAAVAVAVTEWSKERRRGHWDAVRAALVPVDPNVPTKKLDAMWSKYAKAHPELTRR